MVHNEGHEERSALSPEVSFNSLNGHKTFDCSRNSTDNEAENSSFSCGEWSKHLSSNGRFYYYNSNTGENTYKRPSLWVDTDEGSVSPADTNIERQDSPEPNSPQTLSQRLQKRGIDDYRKYLIADSVKNRMLHSIFDGIDTLFTPSVSSISAHQAAFTARQTTRACQRDFKVHLTEYRRLGKTIKRLKTEQRNLEEMSIRGAPIITTFRDEQHKKRRKRSDIPPPPPPPRELKRKSC